jgi:hypothetical protein
VVGRTTLDGAIVTLARAFGPGLMTLLAWGVLSFGAVYPWAYWPLFAGAAVFGVWGVAATHGWRDPRVRALTYALGAVVAAMSVQIVALPAWLIARLSPGVDRFFRQFEIGYHPASLHTLSLDPAATAVNLAEVAALGALLLGAARAMRNVKIEWLTSQIMGLAIGVATIGIVQKALGKANQPLVYGFWHSIEPGSPFGPFINRNHFAGWMAMALPLVVAYAWALLRQSERPAQSGPRGWIRWATSVDGNRTALVASAALIMGVATVLTQSRSGMAAVTVALLTVAWFIGRRSGGRWRAAAIAYVVVVLLGAVSWAGADLVAARFQRAPAEIGGRLAGRHRARFSRVRRGRRRLCARDARLSERQPRAHVRRSAQRLSADARRRRRARVRAGHRRRRRLHRRRAPPVDVHGRRRDDVLAASRRRGGPAGRGRAVVRRVQPPDAGKRRAVRRARGDGAPPASIGYSCVSRLISTASSPISTRRSSARPPGCSPISIRP